MINYSVEKLFHFNCSDCKKWWTIGDFDIQEIHCPYCSKKSMPAYYKDHKDYDTIGGTTRVVFLAD